MVDVPGDDRTWFRDMADDKFIRLAIGAGCRFLVSGDDDLLAFGEVERVRIVSPGAFLRPK